MSDGGHPGGCAARIGAEMHGRGWGGRAGAGTKGSGAGTKWGGRGRNTVADRTAGRTAGAVGRTRTNGSPASGLPGPAGGPKQRQPGGGRCGGGWGAEESCRRRTPRAATAVYLGPGDRCTGRWCGGGGVGRVGVGWVERPRPAACAAAAAKWWWARKQRARRSASRRLDPLWPRRAGASARARARARGPARWPRRGRRGRERGAKAAAASAATPAAGRARGGAASAAAAAGTKGLDVGVRRGDRAAARGAARGAPPPSPPPPTLAAASASAAASTPGCTPRAARISATRRRLMAAATRGWCGERSSAALVAERTATARGLPSAPVSTSNSTAAAGVRER